MDIRLEKVTKSYQESVKKRRIFDSASVVFPSGRVSVVLGKSGVGKTSLLNLISGIDVPDNGIVRIDQSDITAMDDTKRTIFRRRHIGFIYQFFNLIPVLNVIENVMLIAQLDGKSPVDTSVRARELLDQAGLLDRADQYPDRLSGGEQQRVAIVRALVNNPDIILADEPTGNLDSKTGQHILEMIDDLVKKEQKTLVMVTHSRDAAKIADRVFRVENHQVIEDGET